jgi:hypothetical protein
VKKGIKKGIKKEIKKEIKQEIKQEVKAEPPCTSTPATKRPRAISGEMSIRKRNWRRRKELEALGSIEGSGELKSLEEILENAGRKGDAGRSKDGEGDG